MSVQKSTSVESWLDIVMNGGYLPENDLRALCSKVKELLMEESNVQPVSAPVTICGDIHGQFSDLLELFKKGGPIPTTRYIFMGDYVDRGYNSVETLQLLLCLKLKYPAHITLLRGNHETRAATMVYGFYDETIHKYGNANPWRYCTELFDYLGIAAIIEGKILCFHGGLSPEIKTIDQVRLIERKMEIPPEGPFCDMIWSDPEDIETWAKSPRGASWLFGFRVTTEFNHINGLELIARGRQLEMDGFKYWFKDRNLVTVWSAPNYCYKCGNVASILNINEKLEQNIDIFSAARESSHALPYNKLYPYFL